MLWRVEIGTVLTTPEGSIWGPFCRKTCLQEEAPKILEEELKRLAGFMRTVAESHGGLERLVYVKIHGLSYRSP